MSEDVAVIGAGPMGLAVAYELAKKGRRVVVLERDDRIGGMSATTNFAGTRIERYYHFVCKPDATTFEYLREVGGYAPAMAAKRLEFIEHPLWRTYVFVYAEGEALLRRWVEAVPLPERVARFGRLLHEQITPRRLLEDLA